MKIIKDMVAYAAEDGSVFLDKAACATHDALLYISKTIDSHGATEVTNAILRVEAASPGVSQALTTIAAQLQTVHSMLPDNDKVPKIASTQAPDNVRSDDAEPKTPRPSFLHRLESRLGIGGENKPDPETPKTPEPPKPLDPPKPLTPPAPPVVTPIPADTDGKAALVKALTQKPTDPPAAS